MSAARLTVNERLTARRAARHHWGMPTDTRKISRTAAGSPYLSDNSEYLRGVARMIAAAGRRAGSGDPADLAELIELRAHVELATARALIEQREGFSLAELAAELGVTRQAVHAMTAAARATLTAHTMEQALAELDAHH